MAARKKGIGKPTIVVADVADPADVEFPPEEAREQKAIVALRQQRALATPPAEKGIHGRPASVAEARSFLDEDRKVVLAERALLGLLVLVIIVVVGYLFKAPSVEPLLEVIKVGVIPLATLIFRVLLREGKAVGIGGAWLRRWAETLRRSRFAQRVT